MSSRIRMLLLVLIALITGLTAGRLFFSAKPKQTLSPFYRIDAKFTAEHRCKIIPEGHGKFSRGTTSLSLRDVHDIPYNKMKIQNVYLCSNGVTKTNVDGLEPGKTIDITKDIDGLRWESGYYMDEGIGKRDMRYYIVLIPENNFMVFYLESDPIQFTKIKTNEKD